VSAARRRPAWVEAEYERIGREREAAGREVERMYRWELARVCGEMLGWMALGMFVAMWAFRVNNYQLGMAFLYLGMLVNAVGMFWSFLAAYNRGQARGDW
jgi:hypothetical protein